MRFFCVVAIIGALTATPALAKKKEKKDTVVEAQTIAVRATPPALDDKTNQWLLDLSDGGRVTIALRPDAAPQTVERIKTLTRQHFYDGLAFHRVIDGFMAQGGDPTGTGMHGSKKPDLKAEFSKEPHVRGVCSMARTSAPNSANSQFFICLADARFLDGQYTVWGEVTSGMDAVDALPKGEPPRQPGKIVSAKAE